MIGNLPLPGGNLHNWAQNLVTYLTSLQIEVETPGPKIVQLEYKQTGAKATKDGILMWDPTSGDIVVSKAGVWRKVSLVP